MEQGAGPWPEGVEWRYVDRPAQEWLGSEERANRGDERNPDGEPGVRGSKPYVHEQHAPST